MASIGASAAKAEMFLIVIAVLCIVGASAALVVQYTEAIPTPNNETTATVEQDEPARVPLPAGPRKFQ